MTNAAGEVTTFDRYDKVGNVLQSTDGNGIATLNTYDARQRLLTRSVGGETTTYAYDAIGQLTRVMEADGGWVGYEYDDAHRQVAVTDHLGNRIDYQLDCWRRPKTEPLMRCMPNALQIRRTRRHCLKCNTPTRINARPSIEVESVESSGANQNIKG